MRAVLIVITLLTVAPSAAAHADSPAPPSTGPPQWAQEAVDESGGARARAGGSTTPSNGTGGNNGQGNGGEASAVPVSDTPDGFWVTWRTVDTAPPPACMRDAGAYLDVATQAEADAIADTRNRQTDTWVENQLVLNSVITRRCDDPALNDPGLGGIDGQTLIDVIEGQLPRPTPTIAGGRAITGNRSWLDLNRPNTHTLDETFDLGVLGTHPIQVTATAATNIDWGDGTVSDHTGTGGPWHDGEPGPDDITHTYIDTGTPTIVVIDTWQVTFDIAGLPPINATATLDPVPLDITVTEVRSTRND